MTDEDKEKESTADIGDSNNGYECGKYDDNANGADYTKHS